MISTAIYKNIKEDFKLDESLLRKAVDTISSHTNKLGYETNLAFKVYKNDGTFHSHDHVNQVIEEDNSSRKKISRLIVEVHRTENLEKPYSNAIFVLDFDNDHESKIYYGIDVKDRDWTFLFADNLESQVSRMRRGKFWVIIQDRDVQMLAYTVLSILIGLVTFNYFPLEWMEEILAAKQHTENAIVFNACKLLVVFQSDTT